VRRAALETQARQRRRHAATGARKGREGKGAVNDRDSQHEVDEDEVGVE
jgi:hypothetical protein